MPHCCGKSKKSGCEDEKETGQEAVPRENLGKRGSDTYIDMAKMDGPTQTMCLLEKPPDKKVKRHSIHGMMEEENVIRPHQEMAQLSLDEKKFLLAVERGDVASTRRMLQRAQETGYININCVDPLGRSALLMAIDNENLEMVELLIEHKVETKDALLHAISEEFVEAVEVLLDHEETIHKPGELHSWEALPPDTATFTPDITPLILSAHRDNYEIIKILLDRGATLPMPHDVRLSFMEHEFKTEYQELRKQCQDFATALLDHTRSSYELEVLLNHDPSGPAFEHGERMHLNRLKLAIKLRQKKFVAHSNVQQLLASIWYEGLPGFRRKNMVLQALEIVRIGIMFPLFSIAYILAPHSVIGQTMRKPFIKFICHSASYFTFLFLLILASQRIENLFFEEDVEDVPTKRGAKPSLVEWIILAWVGGLIWSEIKQLWDVGLEEYIRDMWNVIDFITNSLYVATVALRIVSYYQLEKLETERKLSSGCSGSAVKFLCVYPDNHELATMVTPLTRVFVLLFVYLSRGITFTAARYFLLILASQRIENLFFEEDVEDVPTKRGAKPSLVEWIILAWVGGLIWSEIKQLWDVGLEEYIRDMWNVIDFITNSLYVATVALRIVSYYQVQRNPKTETIKREDWDAWDPMLISEGLFSAANIFSSLKLVYIFSVNPHLGPLQVSLSRMVMDIMKFFFLYVLVLFAFSCGLNQLLWYYADAERLKCPSESKSHVCVDFILDPKLPNPTRLTNCTASEATQDSNACTIWRRFANLFETSQTLFWAVFGLVDLESFELSGIKVFTRFWGMLMFGTYSVINIVVLLNLLIAMMNHSYQLISERADVEWKFARSKLWISFFEEGGTCPPPFNIIPTPKSIWYCFRWLHRKFCGHSRAVKKEHMKTIRKKVKQASERDFRYQSIMRNLVRRYVTVEQRKAENQGVTEDDVNEIKQDISAFRFELIEILKNSGMNTSTAASSMGSGAGGKKNRQKERRLMKGFNIGPQPSPSTGPLPPVAEFIASLQNHHNHEGHNHNDIFGSTLSGIFNQTPRRMQQQSTVSSSQGSINEGPTYHIHHHNHHRISSKHDCSSSRFNMKRSSSHKRRWGTIIEAAKTGKVSRLIGRSRSEDSVCNSNCQENGHHHHSRSHSNSPASDDNGSSASDSNPSLDNAERPVHGEHQEHHNHHSIVSGLALLKKKRKKFSASRNTSPVVIPPNEAAIEQAVAVCIGKNNKKISQVLQRASSVPTRVSEVIQFTKAHHEHTQSQQDSVDIPVSSAGQPTLTPSTTEESVNAAATQTLPRATSSREPLLYNSSSSTQATGSSQTPEDDYKHNNGPLPKLPGVIPLSGHTGWL
ncbi:transient receptor potential-gamma protein [Agrilus planipennis]|uniref:Transient receptor potential-gamma protein n=1 Tax=Agrilus planipennis TaxID=224129 RepID=A0A7F5R763_AGRPL|nr:transient receptor potential-gamma protein [Agrilus planipennis]